MTSDSEILAATWSALVDPPALGPHVPSAPRELVQLVDPAWNDNRTAWRLARQLVTYGHRQKTLAEGEAKREGHAVDAGVIWAYWAALELHEALRTAAAT
jgi:hypothetical protein